MNSKVKSEILEWIKTICIAGAIAMGVSLVIQPTMVSGLSMYPTLEENDYLMVSKVSYIIDAPERGDIIVFKTDLVDSKTNKTKDLVKRVIALPGEHIVIRDSKVYINDECLKEDYLTDIYTAGDIDIIVPKDQVFTMGDNRENSDDSRKAYIGTIPLEDIIGKVVIRMYPFNKVGQVD